MRYRLRCVAVGGRVGLCVCVAAALYIMDVFSVPYWLMAGSLPLLGAIAIAGYYTRE